MCVQRACVPLWSVFIANTDLVFLRRQQHDVGKFVSLRQMQGREEKDIGDEDGQKGERTQRNMKEQREEQSHNI